MGFYKAESYLMIINALLMYLYVIVHFCSGQRGLALHDMQHAMLAYHRQIPIHTTG